MAEFRMPSLGADMDEGTLLEWLVHPGDEVHRGDVVAVVDTAKAAIDVEVFADGVVEELLVEPGRTVPVGTPLARLSAVGAAPTVVPAPTPAAVPVPHSPLVRHLAESLKVDLAHVAGSGPGGAVRREDVLRAAQPRRPLASPSRPRVTPRARRLAAAAGLDLAAVSGTGIQGSVTGEDVRRFSESAGVAPAAPAKERQLARPVRRTKDTHQASAREAIGRLMARSKREIPHYYLTTVIDVSHAMAWVRQHNEGRPPDQRVVPAALLLKATAVSAVTFPDLNGWWRDGAAVASPTARLGVAVSLRSGGLVTPVIEGAESLGVDEVMARLRELVVRARSGSMRSSDIGEPSITVTNLGDQGVDSVLGVIYPPQLALVGFGRIAERPWAVDGMLTVRPVVTASLAADHRASDGHRGALLLAEIEERLAHPEEL